MYVYVLMSRPTNPTLLFSVRKKSYLWTFYRYRWWNNRNNINNRLRKQFSRKQNTLMLLFSLNWLYDSMNEWITFVLFFFSYQYFDYIIYLYFIDVCFRNERPNGTVRIQTRNCTKGKTKRTSSMLSVPAKRRFGQRIYKYEKKTSLNAETKNKNKLTSVWLYDTNEWPGTIVIQFFVFFWNGSIISRIP